VLLSRPYVLPSQSQPHNVKALLRRGLALEGLERYRMALADIRAVLAIDPSIEVRFPL
jgi:tetratricopeptide (TPR) repeat protein